MNGPSPTLSCPTSLEPLETNKFHSRPGTASQLRLHARWWRLRAKLINALENSCDEKLVKRSRRLDGCCCAPLLLRRTDGKAALSLQACKDRLCPRCQRERGSVAARRIAAAVRRWGTCRFITLTLRHREAGLAAELDRLHDAFRSIRKTEGWKERVVAGVWSIEVTRNRGTGRWHAHIHLLYHGDFFPQKTLSKLWEKATGDSSIVDVRAVPDRDQTARYIAEYVAKPADAETWSDEEICEYAAAMHGRRLIHTFGTEHGGVVDPAEEKATAEISEIVAPLRFTLAAAKTGDEEAGHAIEILQRLGPTYAMACGLEPLGPAAILTPVEDWEHELVHRVAKRCLDEHMAAELAPPARPPLASLDRPSTTQPRLWSPVHR